VAVRGGCFCNPGAGEQAFGLHGRAGLGQCLDRLGPGFSHAGLRACLGGDVAVGALRMSLGLPSSAADVDRLLAAIDSFDAHARSAASTDAWLA
jgi:selenocysteine lyase/cysteine desulfurase